MRPTREEALIETAFVWARRGTCTRLQVGCVIHREGRILVLGYNGAPAGMPHCDHNCDCYKNAPPYQDRDFHLPDCNSLKPCETAEHAERNAIAFAARHGVGLNGSSLVVTHQPCKPCAMAVVNAGIENVTYVHPYRLKDGLHLLLEAGVLVQEGVAPDSPF